MGKRVAHPRFRSLFDGALAFIAGAALVFGFAAPAEAGIVTCKKRIYCAAASQNGVGCWLPFVEELFCSPTSNCGAGNPCIEGPCPSIPNGVTCGCQNNSTPAGISTAPCPMCIIRDAHGNLVASPCDNTSCVPIGSQNCEQEWDGGQSPAPGTPGHRTCFCQ